MNNVIILLDNTIRTLAPDTEMSADEIKTALKTQGIGGLARDKQISELIETAELIISLEKQGVRL